MISRSSRLLTASSISSLEDRHFEGLTRHPERHLAPDFTVTGATRYGVLQDPVRLSDLRGEVVVLAFFFRARTRG